MADEKDKVILLDYWKSPYAARVKIALEEKNVDYECIEQDLLGTKSSLLLEMNPIYKRVPVLIHDSKPISESLVIVRYIDDVWFDRSPLFPSDPYLRSKARFWADFVDNKVFAIGNKIWKVNGEEQKTLIKEFIECLKLLENELNEDKFFGGDNFGYVDLALVSLTNWLYALEKCGNFSVESECPKIIRWAERCNERPSVSKCLPHPHVIYEYVLDLKKMFGIE